MISKKKRRQMRIDSLHLEQKKEFSENICKEIKKVKEDYGTEKAIDLFEEKVLSAKSGFLSYFFVKEISDKRKKEHEQIVIDSKNPEAIILFAKDIEGADIDALQEVILNMQKTDNNVFWAYKFASNVRGADIRKLANIVIESKNVTFNHLFAEYVNGADINAHAKIIINSNDLYHNYEFAKKIKNANIKLHQNVISQNKNAYYSLLFAKTVKGANIDEAAQIILESKNPEYCCDFVSYFQERDGFNIRPFEEIIIKYGTIEQLIKFMNFKNADTQKIKNAIIRKTDDLSAKQLKSLAKKIEYPSEDLKKLVRTKETIFNRINRITKSQ